MIDGQNRRIGKKVDGVLVQRLIYADQLRPAAEIDADGNVVSRFIYGSRSNVPDMIVKADTTYRVISDHLGSPRLVVDSVTGTVAEQIDYDEFGNILSDTNPDFQPFGFAGGLYDADTKLVRFGARDYDPRVGRWTGKDSIGFGGDDTNLYGYVFSDPIDWIDSDGMNPGDPYKSRDAAASAAISEICGISRTIQREFGGYIYRLANGSFSYTPQLHGYKYDMRNLGSPSETLPRGVEAVGSYHTHGDYDPTRIMEPEDFSDNDRESSHSQGIPAYLGTPSGRILRYNPYPNSAGGYQTQIGRCPCGYRRANATELW